jgi:hypothetical protein
MYFELNRGSMRMALPPPPFMLVNIFLRPWRVGEEVMFIVSCEKLTDWQTDITMQHI